MYSEATALSVKGTNGLASEKLAKLCREIALDKKAEDAIVLDVRGISNVADYFLICNGTSEPHLKAIADEIARRLCDEGIRPLHRDGYPPSRWIVMDYNDVLIHIFHPELRQRYGLEDLWGDAKRVR
jgi:ribosome-associated protein